MSSASLYGDVRSACRAAVQAMSTKPGDYAWEGFTYTPVQGKSFIEDKLTGVADTPVANRAIQHRIVYLLTLKYPSNLGTADIEGMAGALLDAFKVGTTLTHGSSSALCMKAERRGAIIADPEWLNLTVQVSLMAFTLE